MTFDERFDQELRKLRARKLWAVDITDSDIADRRRGIGKPGPHDAVDRLKAMMAEARRTGRVD